MPRRTTRRPAVRTAARATQPADLLLEIGTEELPAAYLPDLIQQLADRAAGMLRTQGIAFVQTRSFGTPRRLVLRVERVGAFQSIPAEEVRGPAKRAAYDGQGKPTPALAGFVKSRGGRLEDTKIVATEKGEYVYLVKPARQVPVRDVLPGLLAELIGSLKSPKTMRWDASGVRFARPIRWLAAWYGAAPLKVAYGLLKSEAFTWLGGPLRPKRVRVASIQAYFQLLKRAGVLLHHDDRRRHIERLVLTAAKKAGGAPAPEMLSHGLLDEVTFLTERPVPLLGQYDAKYLALPREVLLASMAKHQRVFAVQAGGKLRPSFVAILDGPPGNPREVRTVCERILNARLADSLLFWNNDRKQSLEQADLTGVTFHEKLGSMADKVQRLLALNGGVLEQAWRLSSEEHQSVRRACELAKSDLVTTMVKEFPTLQGVMGKHYALEGKEPKAVAEAIEEHYLPLAGRAPQTLIGSAVALLDKYDTISSYFGVGIEPTGDQDPFGLRRAAQGIVEITWRTGRPVPLDQFFNKRATMSPFDRMDAAEAQRIAQRLARYILDRLYTFDWPGAAGGAPPKDCIDAVLATPCPDLTDAMERIVSLQRLYGERSLYRAAKVVERTRNILKGAPAPAGDVDRQQFQEPQEEALWKRYEASGEELKRLVAEAQYIQATQRLGEVFFDPLNEFFATVMVNVPDEALRRNRLALMKAIHALYTDRVADLSKLAVLQHEESR